MKGDRFQVEDKTKSKVNAELVRAEGKYSVEVSLTKQLELFKELIVPVRQRKVKHVMSLLIELAVYSLNQLDEVPELEKQVCTSTARKWGISGAKDLPKRANVS